MTPERASELVIRWVRFYTRELPPPIAQRRVDEICADLHDHIAYERAQGSSDRRIALSILSRMTRGVTADAAWRRRVQPLQGALMKSSVMNLVMALGFVAIGVAAINYGDTDDSPGLMLIGVLLIVGAMALGVRTWRARSG